MSDMMIYCIGHPKWIKEFEEDIQSNPRLQIIGYFKTRKDAENKEEELMPD